MKNVFLKNDKDFLHTSLQQLLQTGIGVKKIKRHKNLLTLMLTASLFQSRF